MIRNNILVKNFMQNGSAFLAEAMQCCLMHSELPFFDVHHQSERLTSVGFYCSSFLHHSISFQRCGTTSSSYDELIQVFIIVKNLVYYLLFLLKII